LLRAELRGLRTLSVSFIYNTAKRHWRFPAFSTPESLLDAAGMNLPLLIVASFSDVKTAGFLFLAQRLTSIPVGLVSGNLSRVYIGEAPIQLANGSLHTFTTKLWRTLFFLGIGPMLLGMISAPLLTERFLGAEWSSASVYIMMLLPAAFVQFCVVPLSTALHVLSKQAVAMVLKVFGLVAQVGSLLVAYAVGLENPIIGLAVGATVYYIVFTLVILHATKLS
jgi:O-antigen/teichoic acid export membrane protein